MHNIKIRQLDGQVIQRLLTNSGVVKGVSVIPLGEDRERDKAIREGWIRNTKSDQNTHKK